MKIGNPDISPLSFISCHCQNTPICPVLRRAAMTQNTLRQSISSHVAITSMHLSRNCRQSISPHINASIYIHMCMFMYVYIYMCICMRTIFSACMRANMHAYVSMRCVADDVGNSCQKIDKCTCLYIYICAVELKTGPIFAFSSVKNWSNFFLFFVFLFLKISFSLQKEEDFSKKSKKKTKKMTHF